MELRWGFVGGLDVTEWEASPGGRLCRVTIHPLPRITRSGTIVQAIDEFGRLASVAEERGMVVSLETHHDGILSW
jgi:hypothetical protein